MRCNLNSDNTINNDNSHNDMYEHCVHSHDDINVNNE